jgi:hypothetical protein
MKDSGGIFGGLDHIHAETFISAFVIIVAIVVALEKAIALLKRITVDTPFEEMINMILSELMVVGIISIGFTVVMEASHSLDHHWILAIEFAGQHIPSYPLYC